MLAKALRSDQLELGYSHHCSSWWMTLDKTLSISYICEMELILCGVVRRMWKDVEGCQ